MRLPKRDVVASCAVAMAVLLYLLWLADATLPGLSSARATGLAILALGFIASASAVVPGFDRLLHGNKAYLAVTSALGLGALAAGVVVLWSAGSVALAVLAGALVAWWAISTTHHVMQARAELCPGCGARVHETYCTVCGYDLVRRTREELTTDSLPRRGS